MSRRKDPIAPFEIMRRAEQRDSALDGGHEGDAVKQADPVSVAESVPAASSIGVRGAGTGRARKAWWATFDEPLVLRVPRGMAILICLGVFVLIVVAYWVGSSRGAAQKERTLELAKQQRQAQYTRLHGPPTMLRGEDAADVAADGKKVSLLERVYEATGDIVVPMEMDPREAGKNYLVLTLYDRETAVALIEFMAERDVEAAAFLPESVGLAGKGLVEVIYLKGFKSIRGEAEQVKVDMKRLGEAWRIHNKRKGKNLSDMYFRLYQGPNGAS